jgi:hypothetical protein
MEGRITVGEYPAVRGNEVIAVPARSSRYADDWLVDVNAACRAVKRGVAETEDSSVCRYEPIAAAVGCCRYADDRLVQLQAAGRAVEYGVSIAKDPSVGSYEPYPRPSGVGARPTIGLLSFVPPVEP